MAIFSLKCGRCGEPGFPHLQALAKHQLGCTGPAPVPHPAARHLRPGEVIRPLPAPTDLASFVEGFPRGAITHPHADLWEERAGWPEKLPPEALEKPTRPDYQGQYTWGGQEAPREPVEGVDCTAIDSAVVAAQEAAVEGGQDAWAFRTYAPPAAPMDPAEIVERARERDASNRRIAGLVDDFREGRVRIADPAPLLEALQAEDIPVIREALNGGIGAPPPSSGMSLRATREAIRQQLDRVFGKRPPPARTDDGGYR
jgi:hypothetical protein